MMVGALGESAPQAAAGSLIESTAHNRKVCKSYPNSGIHHLRRHQDNNSLDLISNTLLHVNGMPVLTALKTAILAKALHL